METTQQKTKPTSKGETEMTLQVKRPLMTLEEYAAREGVSKSIVCECSRRGILQLRKCKGQTYVVDVPISPYVTVWQSNTKAKHLPLRGTARPFDLSGPDKTVGELVGDTVDIIEGSVGKQKTDKRNIPHWVFLPAKAFKALSSRVKSKRIWQVATVFLTILLVGAIAANLRSHKENLIQQNNLDSAYAGIHNVYDGFVRQKQISETQQYQLDNSQVRLMHLQNELSKSIARQTTLKAELARNQQVLENIQSGNYADVRQLGERVQKLLNWIDELATEPKTSSEADASSK
ncbi:hypothetical protein ACFL1G_05580 [Planctomycetota bacterium]